MTAPLPEPRRLLNFAMLLGLAWLVVVAQLLADHWAETVQTLSDMDDAMRLVQVREFVASAGWFDLHESRLGPPDGYDTHWSRLIDAGLAGLFLLFNAFTDGALAERLMRTVWPMLWLIPAMVGAAAIAWRIAGRPAALIALLFAAVGLPAFQHFIPGRIDHHNVQIALSVLLISAAAWSDRVAWAAAAAGALTGGAMAIGFESLPYVVLCGAALALRFIADPAGARALGQYGIYAAAAIVLAFLVSIAPAHWGGTACDAIAINSVAAAIAGTVGLALSSGMLAGAPWQGRTAGVIASGAVASGLFVAIEPHCLAGPFAMLDPMVRSIWFNHVSEMQPLWRVSWDSPPMGAAIAAFPAVALACTLAMARQARRDFGFLVAAAALLIATVVMVTMVRAFSYAMWLAIPLAAAGALHLAARLRLGTLASRALLVLALTPSVTSAVALAAAQAVSHGGPVAENSRVTEGCLLSKNYEGLARLPPGLVVTDVDYGPFVLALTPHSVLSAPYHRLVAPIIEAHEIFALPPDEARAVAEQVKPTYLVVCGRHKLAGISDAARAASLWGRLAAGDVPGWLELVGETGGWPIRVYRVHL